MDLSHNTDLDNPVWNALSQSHSWLSKDYGSIKFYNPEYNSFGGCSSGSDIENGLIEYSQITDSFFVVGDKPIVPDTLHIEKEVLCYQMVMVKLFPFIHNHNIKPLEESEYEALFNLIQLVMPGYFRPKTPLMGQYFGIYDGQKLVSAAGMRIHMDHYTEVSSIVTDPEYRGRGYAAALTAHCAQIILNESKIPFLHVLTTNDTAISMYERLGFQKRRLMSFWLIKKR
jgi:ribosomal protein S18 acetylase RimI-like enzyme